MQSKAKTVPEYIRSLPVERKKAIIQLRKAIKKSLPKGFKEHMGYGMMGWSVPLSLYKEGYHTTPGEPLPFIGIASQKNSINFYHLGIYSDPLLLKWFQDEWKVATDKRLDMGKSCMRFKKPDDIPYDLIGRLCGRMTPQQWITLYEKSMKNKPKRTIK